MRTLDELLEHDEPAIDLIDQWVEAAENSCEILPPSDENGKVLLAVQVTTRSTLGAIAYETGGILVDHGWLRFLGSGHPELERSLPVWNAGRSDGYYLVADDAVGGFFAINGGAFGQDPSNVYYWAPDSLDWEPLQLGFTDFFQWSLTGRLAQFYTDLRWPSWEDEVSQLPGDWCFGFYPFLWTKEGSIETSERRLIPVDDAFDLKADIVRQLQSGG